MASALTEERLTLIEQAARDRRTLMDRVVIELVDEIRRLRQLLERPSESR
jgi:recombinational DNA repair ATPase RecF